IPFYPSFQKLTLHRVVILRDEQRLDRTASVNVRLIDREDKIDEGLYGGAVSAQLLLQDVRVGDTLWVVYSIEGSNPVFGGLWSGDFGWDSEQPIELRRLTVLHPKQRPMQWRQAGDFRTAQIAREVDQTGEMVRLRFEERGLAPIEFEAGIPAEYLPARFLQFTEHKNWQSVASWADGLFPKAPDSEALRAVVKQFSGLESKAAQVAAALFWVQNEIRYFSVSIGENSHRPQAPPVVLQRRYGDCKDKSYLLVSILSRLGIQAKPVLVSAQASKYPNRALPTPGVFDHVIVQVQLDGKTYFVDPARLGQRGALADLPISFPGADVLVVDANSTGLAKVPEQIHSAPEFEHIDHFSIASLDGDIVLAVREVFRGDLASWARLQYPSLSVSERRREALSLYEQLYPGITLLSDPVLRDAPEQGYFEWSVRYSLPKPLKVTERSISLSFKTEVVTDTLNIPAKVVRNFPFKLPKGKYSGRYRLHIDWPTTVRANEPPISKRIDNAFFSVGEEYLFRGNQIAYLMDYRVKRDQVGAAELPTLAVEARKLDEFINASFTVNRIAIASEESLALSFRAYVSAAIAAALQPMTDSEPDKGQAGMDPADWCTIAIAAGHMDETLLGSRNSISSLVDNLLIRAKLSGANKDEKEATICRGRMLAAKGKVAEATALLSKRELLDENSPWRITLAWAMLHHGDPEGATATALASKDILVREGGFSSGIAANTIAILQRAGKPLPEDLSRMASEIRDGPWPRPILAYQIGLLTAEQLIDVANRMSPDARSAALTEAWFYIGQKQLSEKEVISADKFFRSVTGQGAFTSLVYSLARTELRKLESADQDYVTGQVAYGRRNYELARTRWLASAEQGNPRAEFALGSLYHAGEGVTRDYATALVWFNIAAEKRDALAQNMLGVMHVNGEGVEKSEAAGLNWFRQSAEGGNATAAHNLGLYYLRGTKTINQDIAQAEKYLNIAADRGNSDAQLLLAKMYFEGTEVKKNDSAARYFAALASMQWKPAAMVILGDFHAEGRAQKKDLEAAKWWYQLASQMGNADAQARLAQLKKQPR
ncbi:MAG: DUF3857 domain-containing protein, partial [Burkholderiales bacterium]